MQSFIENNIYIWLLLYLVCMAIGHIGYRYKPDNDNPNSAGIEEQFRSRHIFLNFRYGSAILFVPLFFSNIFFALFAYVLVVKLIRTLSIF